MAGSAVNIARALLHDKVLPGRPPSGKRDRDKIIHSYARQLSSAVAKNYRPGSATTSSRASSASSNNVKLFVKVDYPRKHRTRGDRNNIGSTTITGTAQSASRHRRVQSANARLTNSTEPAKPKPEWQQSARVHWERKGSDHSRSTENLSRLNNSNCYDAPQTELYTNRSLEPSVKGYTSRICQSESDISKVGKPLKSCLKGSVQSVGASQGDLVYRTVDSDLTDEALGVLVDDEDTEEDSDAGSQVEEVNDVGLPLPRTLWPLAHWWTPDIPPEHLGIDHLRCWVFLPSMVGDYHNLPVIPAKVTDPEEELPYKEIIRDPVPWKKRPLDEPTCNHGSRVVPPIKIMDLNGHLMHETSSGRRTVDVVRREILELEQLMKGIGMAGSCSLVVQYQYEINQLQIMVNNTLGRVKAIEKREREKQEALEAKIKDYCGLRKFYKEHDEVIRQIRIQHSQCVRELAILERSLKLDSDRAHFRRRHRNDTEGGAHPKS